MWEPNVEVRLTRLLRAVIQAARAQQPVLSGDVIDLAEERFRQFEPDADDLEDKQALAHAFDEELEGKLASGDSDEVVFDHLWRFTTTAVQSAPRCQTTT